MSLPNEAFDDDEVENASSEEDASQSDGSQGSNLLDLEAEESSQRLGHSEDEGVLTETFEPFLRLPQNFDGVFGSFLSRSQPTVTST